MTINENNVFSKPTFQAFLPLLDNYKSWIGEVETLTSSQWNEINHFLDVIMQTSVMDLTYKFLLDNGKVANMADFRDTIKELWFNLYSRSSSGPASGDSSGFEHVIVGELKPDKVSGFHNWVQFYMEEKAGRLNYKGYKAIAEPNMVAALFDWQGKTKSKGSFFYGVSPEFDIAIYSICALMHPSLPLHLQHEWDKM
uniref:Uridylate-specific endoribonuclease n=1 Tax=Pinctada fucata TaxID=50426 RepID=A0A194AK59_PINFU